MKIVFITMLTMLLLVGCKKAQSVNNYDELPNNYLTDAKPVFKIHGAKFYMVVIEGHEFYYNYMYESLEHRPKCSGCAHGVIAKSDTNIVVSVTPKDTVQEKIDSLQLLIDSISRTLP